jgi:hypothetical protein
MYRKIPRIQILASIYARIYLNNPCILISLELLVGHVTFSESANGQTILSLNPSEHGYILGQIKQSIEDNWLRQVNDLYIQCIEPYK